MERINKKNKLKMKCGTLYCWRKGFWKSNLINIHCAISAIIIVGFLGAFWAKCVHYLSYRQTSSKPKDNQKIIISPVYTFFHTGLYKGSFIFHAIQKETILVWKGKETLIRISWNGKIDTTTEKCSGKSIFLLSF